MSGTLGLTGEWMSKIDTAWLRMDTSANLRIVGFLTTSAKNATTVTDHFQLNPQIVQVA
jgi:hypothetical protein